MFLFISCFQSKGQGQYLEIADSLNSEGEILKASVYYERALFHNPGEDEVRIKKAMMFKKGFQYQKALSELDKVQVFRLDDPQMKDLIYNKVLLNYLLNDFSQARFHIEQGINFLDSTYYDDSLIILDVLVLNENRHWAKALKKLKRTNKDLSFSPDEVYADTPSLKSPLKAEWLSTFIPGTGQIYAGYPGRGIASFLLQAGALAFGAYHIVFEKMYLIGFFTGAGLFQRFYFGGKKDVKNLVEKKNYLRAVKFNKSIKQRLAEEI